MHKIKIMIDGALSIVDNFNNPKIEEIDIAVSADDIVYKSWSMAGESLSSSILKNLDSMTKEEKDVLLESIE